MSPFDFACRAKTFILGLISDAAASNLAMVKQMQQRCPQNTVVLHMKCAAHQVHLCSAPLWVGLGFLSDVFCTTNVLQSGPVWLDLQTFAQQIVEERFEVSFYPPHPDHQRFSKLVVEHTLLAGHDGDERDRKNKQELAARLLQIFNGDWMSTKKSYTTAILHAAALPKKTPCAGPRQQFAKSCLQHIHPHQQCRDGHLVSNQQESICWPTWAME